MSERLLMLGTSFVGAIQAAWFERFPDSDGGSIGLTGPQLTVNMHRAWSVDGTTFRMGGDDMRVYNRNIEDVSSRKSGRTGKRSFVGLSQAEEVRVDLASYDSILLIDMFFRPIHEVVVTESGELFLERQPVTQRMLRSGHINNFRGSTLSSKANMASTVSVVPMLRAIREAVPDTPLRLVGTGRPYHYEKTLGDRYPDIETARRSLDLVDALNVEVLDEIGIAHVPQPASVLDDEGVLTRTEFSLGPHKFGKTLLDPHLTTEYGHKVLESMGY